MSIVRPDLKAGGGMIAWRSGFWARRRNQPFSTNPYRQDTSLWYWFHQGFKAADDNPDDIEDFCYDRIILMTTAIKVAISTAKKRDLTGLSPLEIKQTQVLVKHWETLLETEPWAVQRKYRSKDAPKHKPKKQKPKLTGWRNSPK